MRASTILFGLGVCGVASAAGGCGGGEAPRDSDDAAVLDAPFADGARPLDAGVDAATGACASAADCDDSVDCTTDSCTTSGRCLHVLTPALCGPGESCSAVDGCTPGRICGTSADCTDDDPCTMNERCDPASRVCLFAALDGDGDGDPPRVCGGTDCDDSMPGVSGSSIERCDQIDDDCDGRIDEGADLCGPNGICDRFCTCPASLHQCADGCFDLMTDDAHCGACDFAECGAGSHCVAGECRCADGRLDCFGGCTDERTDPQNCGACDHRCSLVGTCVNGSCECRAPAMFCGTLCVDVTSDPTACGNCTTQCRSGEDCLGGVCTPCGGPGETCCDPFGEARCDTGTCNAGVCPACGGLGDPCCGTSCNAGLACTGGSCTMPACSIADGVVGGHCGTGSVCSGGAACAVDGSGRSIDASLGGIRQGIPVDPAHPLFAAVATSPISANDPPFHAFRGSMCAVECDLDAATDACGTCASCSSLLTQSPIVAAFGGAELAFPTPRYTNDGVCRIACDYSPTTRGSCPPQTTCDAFGEVCVESCTTDAECNLTYDATFSGELVSVIPTGASLRCDTTLGRCVPRTSRPAAHVGEACASSADCAPGTGYCLVGNRCSQLGCDSSSASCDGGRGVCLRIGESQTLCIQGCGAVADCGGGNVCSPLSTSVGGFTGICLGVCADDTECAPSETCSNAGRCVPRCNVPNGIGPAAGCLDAGSFCRPDHAGASYGFCTELEAFCGALDATNVPAANASCATGYVCDELLATGGGPAYGTHDVFGDGHCTRACTTNGDCTGGTTCVTSGPYAGLCRRQGCSAAVACPSGQVCDTPRAVCVEAAPTP